MTNLPFASEISQGSSRKRRFKANRAQFGDGYSQRVREGLNNTRDIWNIEWTGLDENQKDFICLILDREGSWGLFNWTAFGDTEEKKWSVVGEYNLSTRGGQVYAISCVLMQEFA